MSVFGSLAGGGSASVFGEVAASPGLATDGAGLVATETLTFTKQDGSASVTMNGSVELAGNFKRMIEGGTGAESRELSSQLFKILLSEDPGDALGAPLSSNDAVTWNALTLLVVGTAVQDGDNYVVMAELIA